MPLQQALQGDSAVVADEFLIRLNAHVGQTLRLGGRNFTITAALKQEPDRISAAVGMGPRVMISQAALARTGLLAPGSRAGWRLLVKLPEKPPRGLTADAETAAIRTQLEAALPDAQVMDYREGNPALTRGLDNATSILSLICLVAMVLGAIGVAMAMHAHLEQRMDMLAILKAVGADSSDLLRIFLLQTLGARTGRSAVGRGRGRRRHGGAAGGVRQSAHLSSCISISLAVGAGRHGNRPAHHAALLFAAAARCARGEAGAGAAQACRGQGRRASAAGLRAGGRAACNSASQPRWWPRWAPSHGRSPIRRKWARGLRCCSPSRWWFCWPWRLWRCAACVSFSIARVCACPRRCATASPISTGREINPPRCWRRWARESCSSSRSISCRKAFCAICAKPPRRACPMSFWSMCAPTRLRA